MPYGKAYMRALLKIAARYKHSQKILHRWSGYKILINALFVISLFWQPTALDDRDRRLVHAPYAHPW